VNCSISSLSIPTYSNAFELQEPGLSFVNSREHSAKGIASYCKFFTKFAADSRRFTQIRIRRIHRRDAEFAEDRNFCPIARRDWAKPKGFN